MKVYEILNKRKILSKVFSRPTTTPVKTPSATRSVAALGPLADTVIKWGTIWGIAEPLYNCSTKIARAYELNKSGDPNWQGQKLQGAIQFYLDDCVAEVGAIIAARTLSIAMFKTPGWIMPAPLLNAMAKYTPAGVQNIYQAVAGMTKTVEAAWIVWIGTPQGKEWLAKFLVSGSLIASPFALVRYIVGGWVKAGYDTVADKLVDPDQQSIPAPPTPYQGAKKSGLDPATGNRIR